MGRKGSESFGRNRAEVRLRQRPAATTEPSVVYNLSQIMVPCLVKSSKEITEGFPGGASDKESTCQCRRPGRHGLHPWVGKTPGGGHGIPLQCSCLENPMGAWHPTLVFSPGESHGQRGQAGCSPRGRKDNHPFLEPEQDPAPPLQADPCSLAATWSSDPLRS